ncbi:MAG: hypothetical protein M1840_005315 [Geoglossum simile]|nr:MAG: hypothetical protein M1840_005315 [Geoglossum simile]
MGLIGLVAKAFLFGCNRTEVQGLEKFVRILDERKRVEGRKRGLLTVSNHISVIDDPVMWGTLPLRHLLSPDNLRWSLGSHDICFKNKVRSNFFTLGQVLPTHRSAYSAHGGLFQPTMTQCIRLLSSPPFTSSPSPGAIDPLSSPSTYTTTGSDTFPAPSSYQSRSHSWVHIFPEGKVRQHPTRSLRYFKWGIARLILEADPCPTIVPVWIEGLDNVIHHSRPKPRFIPRMGEDIKIVFGEEFDAEQAFGALRSRWRDIVRKGEESQDRKLDVGELSDRLKGGEEVMELRIECAMRVREEVLKVRKGMGWPDEEPENKLAKTWKEERDMREGKRKDGSWEKDM